MNYDRKNYVTGSDIATICGKQIYSNKSLFNLYLMKRGLIEYDTSETEQQSWGKILESNIANYYSNKNNVSLEGGIPIINGYYAGTPDRILKGFKKGLEIKTMDKDVARRLSSSWGEEGTDQIPDPYLLQCVWYMMLTDFNDWDVAVLIGGNNYKQYSIKRNINLENKVLKRVNDFWNNHVVSGNPPPLQLGDDISQWIKKTYSTHSENIINASKEDEKLIEEYFFIKKSLQDIENKKELIEQRIKMMIGENMGIISERYKITYKQSKCSKRVDYQSLLTEAKIPLSLIEKFTKETEGNRRIYFSELIK